MQMSRASWAVVGIALAIVLSGCGSADSSSTTPDAAASDSATAGADLASWPVLITADDLPALDPVIDVLPAAAPDRIVTLATGAGEILAAMGAGDRVVGRDETSLAPQIAGAPVVTKAHQVSAEKVLALNPDLVIVDSATGPPEVLDQIRAAGVRVELVPDTWSVADMAPRIDALAGYLGIGAAELDDVKSAVIPAVGAVDPAGPRVAFLYLRGPSSIYLLGGDGSGADALIAAAGGVDVGAEAGYEPFTPLTAEALIAAAPDVLLVMTEGLASVGGVEGLRALPGVAQTPAGQSGQVIAVDDTVLLSFGARTGALIEALRAGLNAA